MLVVGDGRGGGEGRGGGGGGYLKLEDHTNELELLLLHGWVARKVKRWYHLSSSVPYKNENTPHSELCEIGQK